MLCTGLRAASARRGGGRGWLAQDVVRTLTYTQPTRDLKSLLLTDSRSTASEEAARQLKAFVDLLDQSLVLNPEKRITPEDALRHPFLKDAAA